MLNLRQLSYFVAVADAGSYTGAAERLHVSQPALSTRLKELEATLGVRLFDRHARGATLTESGHIFLPHAREVIAAVKRAELALEDSRSATLPVSIGVTPTLGAAMLPKLLEQCWRLEPGMSLKVQQGPSQQLAALVAAEELDAALCYYVPATLKLTATAYYSEDLYVVGAPKLFAPAASAVTFADLAAFTLVLDPRGHHSREITEEIAVRQGVTLRVAADVEPLATKKALMLSRDFCAVMPAYLFHDEVREGTLAALRIVDPAISLTLQLLESAALSKSRAGKLRHVVETMVRTEIGSGNSHWRLPDQENGSDDHHRKADGPRLSRRGRSR